MRLARPGEYGVDLFFVLSGWLIGSLYWKESARFGNVDLPRFWARRWMRTIPPYLMALLLAWLAVRVERHEPFNWGYLVFIQNYYKTIPYFLVSWSLCIEEHFYLFLPMLLALAGRSKTSLAFQFTLLILLAPVCRCLMPTEALSAPFGFAHTATHMRMEGLLMGFWAAWLPVFSPSLWLSFKRFSPLVVGASAIILAILAFRPSLWMYRVGLTVLALGLIGVLVWITDKQPGTVAKARVIHAVAVSSYSVYLTHALMLHLARKVLAVAAGLPWYTYFPMALISISVGGAVFYFAVERTSIQLRDRWAARRKGVVIGVPVTTHV
jgi:peptidoglycan/LPS O-acetylase OafA/YrhL